MGIETFSSVPPRIGTTIKTTRVKKPRISPPTEPKVAKGPKAKSGMIYPGSWK